MGEAVAGWGQGRCCSKVWLVSAGTLPGCRWPLDARTSPLYCRLPLYCLQYIRFLTQTKAYSQILGRIFAGQRKNRFVQEE